MHSCISRHPWWISECNCINCYVHHCATTIISVLCDWLWCSANSNYYSCTVYRPQYKILIYCIYNQLNYVLIQLWDWKYSHFICTLLWVVQTKCEYFQWQCTNKMWIFSIPQVNAYIIWLVINTIYQDLILWPVNCTGVVVTVSCLLAVIKFVTQYFVIKLYCVIF